MADTLIHANPKPTGPIVSPVQASEAAPGAPTAAELRDLATSGEGGAYGVILAAIAVAGGGAAWKFYSDASKNKHEERMERLRIEAEQGKNKGDHTLCTAERVALENKLREATERLDKLERDHRTLALSAGDDLDDRILKIEKKIKRLAADHD
jgi:uncharacterized protein HemX